MTQTAKFDDSKLKPSPFLQLDRRMAALLTLMTSLIDIGSVA